MRIRRAYAIRSAQVVLSQQGAASVPVNLRRIADALGAVVIREPADQSLSGFIRRRPGLPPVIGINSCHAEPRQRFTLAHELGHLILHNDENLKIDYVKLRNSLSSEGTDVHEIEANAFAAELLMPANHVKEAWSDLPADMSPEQAISMLAEKFDVSEQAMAVRLGSLGLLEPAF